MNEKKMSMKKNEMKITIKNVWTIKKNEPKWNYYIHFVKIKVNTLIKNLLRMR